MTQHTARMPLAAAMKRLRTSECVTHRAGVDSLGGQRDDRNKLALRSARQLCRCGRSATRRRRRGGRRGLRAGVGAAAQAHEQAVVLGGRQREQLGAPQRGDGRRAPAARHERQLAQAGARRERGRALVRAGRAHLQRACAPCGALTRG